MEIIEIVQAITGNTDNAVLFSYWEDKAVTIINKYLNKEYTKEQATSLFKDAIIQIIVNEYQGQKQSGIKSMTQGQRSVTYKDAIELDDSIKKLLPKPFMRLK